MAVVVADHVTDPPVITRLETRAIESHDLPFLIAAMAGGKDVTQVTRVTGYFSKVASWNKAKQRELRDRHRVTVGANPSSSAKP